MSEENEDDPRAEEMWRIYMTTGEPPAFAGLPWYKKKALRPLIRMLPDDPRCRICYYPLGGIGGSLVRAAFGVAPSKMNPQLCNLCEMAANTFRGGAEIELSMLFADIRGSTAIAEKMPAAEFSRLIDRFYRATTGVLFKMHALVEKLIGDEVTGFFVPGFAGEDHARVAVEAAKGILRATGHGDPDGPWVPVGVGVHTGRAFVGAVTAAGGAADITVLGDTANTAARIASRAGIGEVLFSEVTRRAAGIERAGLEARQLELKGKQEPVDVWVKRSSPSSSQV
jgi:adenylate cyclase